MDHICSVLNRSPRLRGYVAVLSTTSAYLGRFARLGLPNVRTVHVHTTSRSNSEFEDGAWDSGAGTTTADLYAARWLPLGAFPRLLDVHVHGDMELDSFRLLRMIRTFPPISRLGLHGLSWVGASRFLPSPETPAGLRLRALELIRGDVIDILQGLLCFSGSKDIIFALEELSLSVSPLRKRAWIIAVNDLLKQSEALLALRVG
ncbi:hypothetical protein PUNSTDRAFT_49808, partial [Punctularia strigosozonata HHB-11173 SS5]|uniref:uncharacterized protein n=1 Tax=Punctularia strigosozonata (strain HHB-11173) TaxID=741275 RepID=UPI0004416E65